MKTQITFIVALSLYFTINVLGQTKNMETYYDYKKTVLKERFSVLASNPTILHGKYILYFPNTVIGAEGNYNNGEQVGKWTYRFETNGLISKIENYNSSGELDGVFKTWISYEKDIFIKEEGQYKSDFKIGNWKEFEDLSTVIKKEENYANKMITQLKEYENGKLKCSTQYSTKQNEYPIKTTKFYETGEIKSETNYSDSVGVSKYTEHGAYKEWDLTGKLQSEGFYNLGKKHGKFITYDNGKIINEVEYINGITKTELDARKQRQKNREQEIENDKVLQTLYDDYSVKRKKFDELYYYGMKMLEYGSMPSPTYPRGYISYTKVDQLTKDYIYTINTTKDFTVQSELFNKAIKILDKMNTIAPEYPPTLFRTKIDKLLEKAETNDAVANIILAQ